MSVSGGVPPVPAVLRLVQSAVLGRWQASSDALYRELASSIEATAGSDIVVAGCGDGVTAQWLARRTGAHVTGVDSSGERLASAEARGRGLGLLLSYQQSALDDLPHETGVFDAAVGEPSIASSSNPAKAVAELVRVTKPLRPVVLLQLTWTSGLTDATRELLVERLGLRPRLLVEWKQMLRDAGAVEITVQDWTLAPESGARPLPGVLTWRQKMHIVARSWRRRGWRAARGAVERETSLLQQLARERAIGFQLIRGVKWPHPKSR